METLYKIAIGAILLLGIAHCAYTFKKYNKIQPETLWFFSACLGLIFSGLLNYINLNFPNHAVSLITLAANFFQLIFYFFLAFYIRKVTVFSTVIVGILLFISSAYLLLI